MNDYSTARSIDLAELTVEQVQAGFARGAFTAEALALEADVSDGAARPLSVAGAAGLFSCASRVEALAAGAL